MMAALIFWSSCGLLGYTLIGYPAAIALWARLRPRRDPGNGSDPTAVQTPTVTVVVVAHDEAQRIGARIDNLLALEYPRDRLAILVCSDGSTDATVELARACPDPRVSVLAFERRRGKAAVLNDAVAAATGEIVVFADARQRFDPDSVRELVVSFADPRVGAVSGELCFEAAPGAGAVGAGVGFYWRYDKLIRRSESLVDSSVGATGAIYALRRRLFEPIPETTVLDDVLIPMQVVRAGYRTLFNPAARAFDRVAHSAQEEFARKVRTIAGTFQLFARHPWLLNPARNRIWVQTVSHKLLRLLGPLALAGAFTSNLMLLASPFYRVTFGVQVVLYSAALYEHLRSGTRRRRRRGRFTALL
ncbi:MAG TPA: glycosyltransferase family 2 protein, partial [Polyangiales bacterium]|nr:glycosyltransferase family 2 protein [Polyangiales bacterium]